MTTTVERLESKIADELSQHELRDPDYWPSHDERAISNDFVHGLICDNEFLRLVWQHYNEIIAGRLDAGECVDCGRSGGGHWGGCGTVEDSSA